MCELIDIAVIIIKNEWLKVGNSPSKNNFFICFNDNLPEMMKNAF